MIRLDVPNVEVTVLKDPWDPLSTQVNMHGTFCGQPSVTVGRFPKVGTSLVPEVLEPKKNYSAQYIGKLAFYLVLIQFLFSVKIFKH